MRKSSEGGGKGVKQARRNKIKVGELNRRRKWTPQEVHELALLTRARTPVDLIALELRRTENSIRAIAGRKGIALFPVSKKSVS